MPEIQQGFEDDFERVDIGPLWQNTGGPYNITGGLLNISKGHNHPLWLRRRLPENVVVEFDAMSKSPSGDIKVELFGDGESYDPDKGAHEPSGYSFIFGGWNNAVSAICRLNEHGDGVKKPAETPKSSPTKGTGFG